METLREIFSFICGQGRCFVVDGTALPLCQRCLGLYAGAFLTTIWLVTSGIWRRGLIFPAAFAGFAAAFPLLLQIGWYFWTAVAVLGVGVLLITTVTAMGSLISYCIRNLTAKSNSTTVNAQQ